MYLFFARAKAEVSVARPAIISQKGEFISLPL